MIRNKVRKSIATVHPNKRFKKYNKVGSGAYGDVYRACLNDACANKVAVKNAGDLRAEYEMGKKLDKMGVPNVYGYEKRGGRDYMYSEFINGDTLDTFLGKRHTPEEIKTITFQVLRILHDIHKKYPSFRHHDLHAGNIMVVKKDDKILTTLMDFGLSTMDGLPNPTVDTSTTLRSGYGIFRGSDKMYDAHLFLNSLFLHGGGQPSFGPVRTFIKSVFPEEYLGRTSPVVDEARMRDVVHKGLPTYDTLLKHPYFTREKVTIIQRLVPPPPPPRKLNTRKSPVNQNAAKKRAMAFLASKEKEKGKRPTAPRRPALMKPKTKLLLLGNQKGSVNEVRTHHRF